MKERCGLCEDAVALLRPFQQHGQLALELVDIASEPELLRRYGLSIPVLEIDGAVLEWPFERSAVRRALG